MFMVEEYTIGLALLDYVPNLFFLFGSIFIIKLWTQKKWNLTYFLWSVGSILVFIGGIFKAIWKTIIVITSSSIAFLSDYLFIWQTIGFSLMFLGTLFIFREKRNSSSDVKNLIPALAILPWKIPFLAIQTISYFGNQIILIFYSFKRKMPVIGVLLIANVILTFGLVGLASGDLTIPMQWIAESVNTISQACYLCAGYLILRNGDKFGFSKE